MAAAGLGVQAQELSGHTHLLNVSDGVVTLSEQFYRNRIYVEITILLLDELLHYCALIGGDGSQ